MPLQLKFYLLLLFSFISFFSSARDTPADANNNGLIEIYTLEELNMMRFNMAGTSLKTSETSDENTAGCADSPTGACHGYELMNDLDFDTNGDGLFDENDSFWNDGAGWDPIGEQGDHFTANLEGNQFTIRNLYIKKLDFYLGGLISIAENNWIQNLHFENTQLTSWGVHGAVAGEYILSNDSSIELSNFTIEVQHEDTLPGDSDWLGSVIGWIRITNGGELTISDVIAETTIINSTKSMDDIGGIVGRSEINGTLNIQNVSSKYNNQFLSNRNIGGIIGNVIFVENNSAFTLSNCFAQSDFEAETAGGLVGTIFSGNSLENFNISIKNCEAISNIVNTGSAVSGGVGSIFFGGGTSTVELENISTFGSVNFDASLAGQGSSTAGLISLIGGISGAVNVTINNSFYAGTQTVSQVPPLNTGGLIAGTVNNAETTITINNSYWDAEILTEDSDLDNETYGRTTEQLQCAVIDYTDFSVDTSECSDGFFADYSNWDLENIWDLSTATGYPTQDPDSDGKVNAWDEDDDGDGVNDDVDAFPRDPTETADTDGDGTGDNADLDADNDSFNDDIDAFPLDNTEWLDTDGDNIGNNADTDDDGDGEPDTTDPLPLIPLNTDGADHDGDGLADTADAFPLDATETTDTDNDGIGDNSDADIDGDNVANNLDAFPLDPTESLDTDNDNIGNNADTDDDGDGVNDEDDFAPLDPTVQTDPDSGSSGGGSGGGSLPQILLWLLFAIAFGFRNKSQK